MNTLQTPLRVIAYTSGAHPCGIADYHQRLETHLSGLVRTVKLPTARILRDRPLALLTHRLTYRRLAAASDAHEVVLLQLVNTWNGLRPGEYLLPTFVDRIRKPLVVIMHEWPEAVADATTREGALGSALAGAEAAIRRLDFSGLRFDAWFERRFLPRASHVFVHAEHLKARLLEAGVPAGRISCPIMPVYPHSPAPAATDGLPMVPCDRRVVLLFGFPHPRKRYDVAVRALADLPRDVVMVLVGSPEGDFRRGYVEELRQLARETGVEDRFILTGEVRSEALSGIFARGDVALAPASYATGSASLGHLIAAGVPIVASDVPSVVALRDAGAGISTFPTGSVAGCAAVLRRVLDDERYRIELRERSRRFADVHTFARLGASVGEQLRRAVGMSIDADESDLAPAGAHS